MRRPVADGVVGIAVIGTLIALALAATRCASATPTPTDVAAYSGDLGACVANATSYDAGLACLHANWVAKCGPSGEWIDSGKCPDGGP